MNENIFFFKGNENTITQDIVEERDTVKFIQEQFAKILEVKNFSFLLGSGCSSLVKDEQIGIPTMGPLAKEFFNLDNEVSNTNLFLTEDDKIWLKEELKLNVNEKPLSKNIEEFLGCLYSAKYFFENTNVNCKRSQKESFVKISQLIQQTQEFLVKKCLNEKKRDSGKDIPLIKVYEHFFKKLLYRSSNLPKPNIFTTNYDLYPEISLDNLGVHYVNGFSGGIKRYFNPTIFNYALAEKMDLSKNKWNVIDNFFYLYKLHGSVNWIEDNKASKLFKVRELQGTSYEDISGKGRTMIYPTPLKYNQTLGSPYSDLFREFQKNLMQSNNVLIVIGYSFGDEHINNLIYQAFTIPSFRLIIFGEPQSNSELKKLKGLDDPRVWIIGGQTDEGEKLHYFENMVNNVLPELTNDELEDKIESAIRVLLNNE